MAHDIQVLVFHHQVTVKREHQIKTGITLGLLISASVMSFYPALAPHASVVALATNLVWVWA